MTTRNDHAYHCCAAPILSPLRAGGKSGTCIHGLTNVQTVWSGGRIGAVSDYAFG